MSTIGDRIKEIRTSMDMGRTRFGDIIGVSMRTLEAIERRGSSPRSDVLEPIARRWPEYSYWLLTGDTIPEKGHISPALAKPRDSSTDNVSAS